MSVFLATVPIIMIDLYNKDNNISPDVGVKWLLHHFSQVSTHPTLPFLILKHDKPMTFKQDQN